MSLDIKMLRSSFTTAKPMFPKILDHFYVTLFKNYPQAKPLFKKVDMKAQKKALGGSLVFIVNHLDNPKKLTEFLMKMGGNHTGYGVQPEHYEWVGNTLIETFAHFFADAWTEELEEQWVMAYKFIATTMLKGAESKTAPQTTKSKGDSIEEYSRSIARSMLMKSLKEEMKNEFGEAARKQARQLLKHALDEEASKLLKYSKKRAA